MDDVWLRVAVVAAAFLIAVGIAMARRGNRRPVRSIRSLDLAAGVYLFTSEGCSTCEAARSKMDGSLSDEYTELVWEREPERFHALGVDAVPSVLIVDGKGHGQLYPGQPDRALRNL